MKWALAVNTDADSVRNSPDNPSRESVLGEPLPRTRGDSSDREEAGPCLLLSREMGAGGSAIARDVAERLGWQLLDKEILGALASEYGTPKAVLGFVDEKNIGWLTDMVNGWIEGHGFSQLSYVHRMSGLFRTAAKRGKIIILGRGARFILPRATSLSIRIVAPFDFRVEQIVLRQGMTASQARTLIAQSDQDRIAFIEKYFHKNVADPHFHDLVVNVEQLGRDGSVKLIVDAVQCWLKYFGFRSRDSAHSDS